MFSIEEADGFSVRTMYLPFWLAIPLIPSSLGAAPLVVSFTTLPLISVTRKRTLVSLVYNARGAFGWFAVSIYAAEVLSDTTLITY